ncbi:hypothetical protein [Lentibacillus saliphilus]|uniref:hypothetical protein n=1 Tax=Lentibacillus saliphilus TaxID=2737028 RepID=UPI001C30FD32|nr:hypothetical protein [Lentibacillus saliphilus]
MTTVQESTDQAVTYQKTVGLNAIINETDIILRKGAIHQTELVIDKKSSSSQFIDLLEKIIDGQEVTIASNHVHQHDFRTLYNYGFIRNQIKTGDTLLLVENEGALDTVQTLMSNCTVQKRSEWITDADLDAISADKDYFATSELFTQLSEALTAFSTVYYVSSLNQRHHVQTMNKLMVKLDLSFFMALFDNENFLLFGVEPKVTGCYECLEKKVLSRIKAPVHMEKTADDFEVTEAELLLGLGLIKKNIEQTEVNEMSMLTGNVLYFYFPNFEYAFDFNRRTILCNTCAGLNQTDFNEQNAASINITKELIRHEG